MARGLLPGGAKGKRWRCPFAHRGQGGAAVGESDGATAHGSDDAAGEPGTSPASGEAATGPGATSGSFAKTEVVYANLSSDCAIEGVYVVNRFDVEQSVTIRDFGPYESVVNLTDQQVLGTAGADDAIVFESDEGVFFYQGNWPISWRRLPAASSSCLPLCARGPTPRRPSRFKRLSAA